MNYEKFMQLAIDVAMQNPKAPYGAVLVDNETEETQATGFNQATLNPVLHGEIVAINNHAETSNDNWHKLTLFTTAEPCCMCQAAIIWAGIPRVVFGTSIKTLNSFGWRQFGLSAQEVANSAGFSDCVLIGGVLETECDHLFRR